MTRLSLRLTTAWFLVCTAWALAAADPTRYESDHFVLATDISARNAERILDALESMRAEHLAELGLDPQAIPKLLLSIFRSRAGFNGFARRYNPRIVGYRGVTTPRGVVVFFGRSRGECIAALMHELTHMYFRAAGKRPALWLNEGLACYFGGVRRTVGGRTVFGVPNTNRLNAVSLAVRTNKHIPLKKLMTIGKKDFYLERSEDGKGLRRQSLVYGQAATLVLFLKRCKAEGVAGKFTRFLAEVYRTGDTKAAFESIYGTDYARLEKQWQSYVLGLAR